MRTNGQRRGFSLVELLIVILIIALIVAILLPALAGARNASKRTDTESLCAQISSAIGQFQIDNRRLPGLFTVREMASAENQDTRGMSMAENVMFELGFMRRQIGPPVPPTGWISGVGPNATGTTYWVKPDETQGKAYFTPSAKYYAPLGAGSQVCSASSLPLPDLIDGFGNPLLLWIEDEASVGKPELTTSTGGETRVAFVRSTFEAGANGGPAKFYSATNACFLKSRALARGGMDIESDDPEKGTFFAATEVRRLNALAAILGNPNFPKYPNDDASNAQPNQIIPTAARGSFVIQSAGIDGTYLGRLAKKNRGANTAVGGVLYYGSAIKNSGGTDHIGPDGKPFVYDFAKEFDDVIVAGN